MGHLAKNICTPNQKSKTSELLVLEVCINFGWRGTDHVLIQYQVVNPTILHKNSHGHCLNQVLFYWTLKEKKHGSLVLVPMTILIHGALCL